MLMFSGQSFFQCDTQPVISTYTHDMMIDDIQQTKLNIQLSEPNNKHSTPNIQFPTYNIYNLLKIKHSSNIQHSSLNKQHYSPNIQD